MIFVEGVQKTEEYDLYDVFGRDKIFYKNSIVRVAGWETPVSLIYREGEEVKIRFKKEIEKYAEGFEDEPFEPHPMFNEPLFYDIMVKNYNDEQPIRCLNYAIQQYKKTNVDFTPVKLFPAELKEKLENEELMQVSYPLDSERSLFDASCYWFPVDVDAILIDFKNRETIAKDEAVTVFADGRMMFGHVGYDKKFYRLGSHKNPNGCEIYSFDNGITKIDTPQWLSNPHLLGMGYQFLKEYVVTRDCLCYNYNGDFLENKTKHHKNVKLMNDLIRLLWKINAKDSFSFYDGPYTNLMVPKEFSEFNIDDVERVVIPHLASKEILNNKALEHFIEVKRIIKNAGLENDFEHALRNIVDMNKSKIYGGSKRNICGIRLISNLRKLYKKVGSERLSGLLRNSVELKREVAQINGTSVIEYVVSASDYVLIRDERKVPKTLKKDAFWCSLEPETLIVFSCGSNENFCAVTTKTKSGLGLNRA